MTADYVGLEIPALSVVMVSYNTRELLDQCLKSIARETRVDHEVIVVDNASEDGTPSFVACRHPRVRLIANSENVGFSAGNNQGLKHASGRYQVLLNPDTVIVDRTFDRMVEFFEAHPEVGIVGAKMMSADGCPLRYETWYPTALNYLANSILVRISGDHGNQEVDFVSGACLMIRQETAREIGPLDENIFMYVEDVDWCLRAKRAGWKVYHCAQARVIHLAGSSSKRDVAARVVNIRQAKLYFVRKHFGWLSCLLLKAVMFGESLAKLLFDTMTYAWSSSERKVFKKSRMRGYSLLVGSLWRPTIFIKPAR